MEKIHPEVLRRFGRDPKEVFARDKWACLLCKSKDDLTIDHIDGNGRHSKQPNNDINNLRTLCRKCHGSVDGKRGSGRRWESWRTVVKHCLTCKKEIKIQVSWVRQGKGKHCSVKCRFNK